MKKSLLMLVLCAPLFMISIGFADQNAQITGELQTIGCDGCDDDEKGMFLPIALDREVISTWFKAMFEDGTKVESMKVVNKDKQSYLIQTGTSSTGDCRITRTPVGILDYGDTHVIYMMRVNGTTEKCSGNNCSLCHLSDFGNGCFCLRGSGSCDHEIIKTSVILR